MKLTKRCFSSKVRTLHKAKIALLKSLPKMSRKDTKSSCAPLRKSVSFSLSSLDQEAEMISLQTKISLFSLFLFYLFYSGLAKGEIEMGDIANEIEEWRSASATYVKENQFSSVTGTILSMNTQNCSSFKKAKIQCT